MVGRQVSSGSGRARTSWYSGDAHGLGNAGQGIFRHEAFLGFAEQQADGGFVVKGFDLCIHGGEIKVELPGVLGFEGVGLEFHDDIAFEPGVVEEEVDEELVAFDFQSELATDEGEARAQFQEEAGDMADEGILDVAFMRFIPEAEEIEVVGVFQNLCGKIGMDRGEPLLEVVHRCPLTQIQLVIDVQLQRGAGPGLPDCLTGIPFALGRIGDLGEERDNVEPGQLVSRLLTN